MITDVSTVNVGFYFWLVGSDHNKTCSNEYVIGWSEFWEKIINDVSTVNVGIYFWLVGTGSDHNKTCS